MGMSRNGRTDLPRGSTERSPPLSRTVFSLGRPLTGHNWALLYFLLAGPPFGVSLSWHCSLLVAMSTLTQAPSAAVLTPGAPAPSVIWMWAGVLFSALLALGGCVFFAPPSPVLTFAQSVQLALRSAGGAQRAILRARLAPPLGPVSLLHRLRPLRPLPQGSPHCRLVFASRVHLGAPHVALAPFAFSGLVRIL